MWVGVGLLFAAVPVHGAPRHHDDSVRLRAVAIELTTLCPVTFELMTRELSTLLEETGLRLDWRRDRPSGATTAEELRFVFLDSPGRGAHAGQPVLAASGQSGPAPTVWVYTPSVRAALPARYTAHSDSFDARRCLGVALGRVLAHELVHLLAPEVPHGRGVMAARVRLEAMDSVQPLLDASSAVALAAAARRWRARGGPAPEAGRRARLRQAATVGAGVVAGP